MKDKDKTKPQLLKEITKLRQHAAKLEKSETKYQKTEDALQKSEEKYRVLYKSNLDGILHMDMKGNILDVNKAILDMLGYSRGEILELSFQKLTPPEWTEFDEVALKKLIKKGYIGEFEKELALRPRRRV